MRTWLIFLIICFRTTCAGQQVGPSLQYAIRQLETDPQFKHAIIGMYVVDSKSGSVVFEKNAETGLVPASCQKIITSAAAFDLLGGDYKFKTELAYQGTVKDSILNGSLYVVGYGDPTLGSWRWNSTKESTLLSAMMKSLRSAGISGINGKLYGYDANWESNTTPGGWVWEDIGNYYGAGASALNWRENQYELVLKAGAAKGDPVRIVATKPILHAVKLHSELLTGERGSGDNAWIYLPPYAKEGFVRGTIPAGANNFTISGAMPDAAGELANTLADEFNTTGKSSISYSGSFNRAGAELQEPLLKSVYVLTLQSPPFDSINYWFLKKSINLYGEAMLKAIGFQQAQQGATVAGIAQIRQWATSHGMDATALNIKDGCGLSPSNRVTTKALVSVLRYASKQPWFTSFYNALPEMNGIRMKDGYIGGVRSYTGYIQSTNGNEYAFALIVNNFDGSASTVREKLWSMLNLMK